MPDDRDQFESAMQRMREAFDGVREGTVDPVVAERDFSQAYGRVMDLVSISLIRRKPRMPHGPEEYL